MFAPRIKFPMALRVRCCGLAFSTASQGNLLTKALRKSSQQLFVALEIFNSSKFPFSCPPAASQHRLSPLAPAPLLASIYSLVLKFISFP